MEVRNGYTATEGGSAEERPLGPVSIELTVREAEQLRLEIATLQKYARVNGHLLDYAYWQLATLGINEAPYPGHADTWPTWEGDPPRPKP